MGGFLCGGYNKIKDCAERYKRLDSFAFGKLLPDMKRKGMDKVESTLNWADGSRVGVVMYPTRLELAYSLSGDEIYQDIYFTTVDNNYGGAYRQYFICPFCGRRCRMLYMHRRHFKCRLCANLNYYSQQVAHGTDEAADRMTKFIKNKFGIKDLSPHDASQFRPERPKGMHTKMFIRLSIELMKLQHDYNRQWIALGNRIMGTNF
jgi:hypothetical protein